MRPKISEFIPFYGFRYFGRYFKTVQKTTSKDVIIAMWMEVYHIAISILVIPFVYAFAINKIASHLK